MLEHYSHIRVSRARKTDVPHFVPTPVLPAWAVRWVWDDPRRIPYLLIWKSRLDAEVKKAVRVARLVPQTNPPETDSVRVQQTDGSAVPIYLAWRWQPHGGRSLLLRCWRCQKPRRALYGAKVGDDGRFYVARRADWECRTCAALRYSSEGGYLRPTGLGRLGRLGIMLGAYGNLPRPESWLPYVFTSIPDDSYSFS
jgi:hypothetical protein